jgi:hypothetical protein
MLFLSVFAIAGSARAQEFFRECPTDLEPPNSDPDPQWCLEQWHVIPADGTELTAFTALGPLLQSGGEEALCRVYDAYGLPDPILDKFPPVIEYRFADDGPVFPGCDTPVSGLRMVFPWFLEAGEYTFRYLYPDTANSVDVAFTVAPPPPAPLEVGRVTLDAEGDEADDFVPTVAESDFAWLRSIFVEGDIRLVTDAEPGVEVPQRIVPQSENVRSPPQISTSGFVVWDGIDEDHCEGATDEEPGTCANNAADLAEPSTCKVDADCPEDLEIYVSDGFTTANITKNDVSDTSPRISGTNLVWVQADVDVCEGATDEEPGTCAKRVDDEGVPISCANDADCTDFEIYYADLSRSPILPVRVTDDPNLDVDPRVSESFAVWVRIDENDREDVNDDKSDIFFVRISCEPGACAPDAPRPIDDPSDVVDASPWLSGAQVAWQRREPSAGEPTDVPADFEIFHADLMADPEPMPVRLTENDYSDLGPYIADPHVVWLGFVPDGVFAGSPSGDPEIFFADLSTTHEPGGTRITFNDAEDLNPQVRGPVDTGDPSTDDPRVGIFWESSTLVAPTPGVPTRLLSRVFTTDAEHPGEPQLLSVGDVAPGNLTVSDRLVMWSEWVDVPPDGGDNPDYVLNAEIFSSPPVVAPEPGRLALRAAALGALALLARARRRRWTSR